MSVPPVTTHALVVDAASASPALKARWSEGECVQTLHLGSFDAEGPVLAEMHDTFIPGLGGRMRGKHHEIYLSDLRRTPSDRLRTILRQPVELQQGGIFAQRKRDQVDVDEELA